MHDGNGSYFLMTIMLLIHAVSCQSDRAACDTIVTVLFMSQCTQSTEPNCHDPVTFDNSGIRTPQGDVPRSRKRTKLTSLSCFMQ